MSWELFAVFLGSSIRLAAPLLLAGIGEMVSERAGVLNMSIEGMMLTSALAAAVGAWATGDPLIGLLIAIIPVQPVALLQAGQLTERRERIGTPAREGHAQCSDGHRECCCLGALGHALQEAVDDACGQVAIQRGQRLCRVAAQVAVERDDSGRVYEITLPAAVLLLAGTGGHVSGPVGEPGEPAVFCVAAGVALGARR